MTGERRPKRKTGGRAAHRFPDFILGMMPGLDMSPLSVRRQAPSNPLGLLGNPDTSSYSARPPISVRWTHFGLLFGSEGIRDLAAEGLLFFPSAFFLHPARLGVKNDLARARLIQAHAVGVVGDRGGPV